MSATSKYYRPPNAKKKTKTYEELFGVKKDARRLAYDKKQADKKRLADAEAKKKADSDKRKAAAMAKVGETQRKKAEEDKKKTTKQTESKSMATTERLKPGNVWKYKSDGTRTQVAKTTNLRGRNASTHSSNQKKYKKRYEDKVKQDKLISDAESRGAAKARQEASSGTAPTSSTSGGPPINIEQTRPTYEAPTMAADKVGMKNTFTRQAEIKQLGEAEDIGNRGMSVPTPFLAEAAQQAAPEKIETPADLETSKITASTVRGQQDVEVAQGEVSPEAVAQADEATLSERAEAVGRDTQAEQAALAKAPTRPKEKDYMVAAVGTTPVKVEDIDGPAVITREGATIAESEIKRLGDIAQKRGIDLNDLPEYKNVIKQRIAQQGEAATQEYINRLGEAPEAEAAQAEFIEAGETPQAAEVTIADFDSFTPAKREAYTALNIDAPEAAEMEQAMQATAASREAITGQAPEDIIAAQTDLDSLPTYELVAKRTAQVAEAAQGIAQKLGDAPAVDLEEREAILGEAPKGTAAEIGGIPTMQAAQMQAVTGQARKMAAVDMAVVVAEVPPEVTAAISENPATVEAQIDSGEAPEVNAAVAALPQEALVSTQMENLLAGMEDGETPAWARPALDAVERKLAARGMSRSSVGRDALFNAIIQSALPIASANAQALQERAAQNLNNEQQANLEQSRQIAGLRLQNLANRQTAASQTAQMAQQIKVQQGEFRQQAQILTAQQQQQSSMATAEFAQQKAQQESAQRQQAAVQNLNAEQQMELANLQAMNAAGEQNLNAEQQARLTNYQATINRTMRQAELEQDMTKTNLGAELQVELKNLSEMNIASRDSMSSKNQERLTNLQTLVDFKKTNAQLAQQMDIANLSNEQQIRLANLAEKAAADSANFTEANRFELTRLQTYTQVMSENTQLRQQAELANFSSEEKFALANLTALNQASSDNLNAEQQVELANLNARVQTAAQNAQMRQQIITQDFSQRQQTELTNLEALNKAGAENLNAEQQAKLTEYNAQVNRKIRQAELNQQTEGVNLDARLKMELSELSEKNTTARANMTAEQQTRLANLNALVDFKRAMLN